MNRSLTPPWLGETRRTWRADVIAGITLWGLVVPEAIAYAGLAGVPPEAGLYTVMIALPLYALFGSSRHLVASATSATAATTGGVVAALSMDPADAIVVVSLATALVFLAAAALHLDFIVHFISRPVNEGFIFGLAVFIAIGQVPKLLGVEKPEGNSFELVWDLVGMLGDTNLTTLAIGAGSLAALFALHHLAPRVPAGLLVLSVTIAISSIFDLGDTEDVDTVGELPKGLPGLRLVDLEASDVLLVLAGALGIMLIAMSEALSLGESLAEKHGYPFDARQDMFAFGVSNIGTGMFGGMVGAGSMSATSVNVGAGARTPMSSITCAGMALLTGLFLTPVFKPLPEAVLGALIIHAVAHHIAPAIFRRLRHYAPIELWLGLIAGLGVLLFDALYGLLLAMFVNLVYFIYRSTRVQVSPVALRGSRQSGALVLMEHHPSAELPTGVLGLRASNPLFYANASSVKEQIVATVDDATASSDGAPSTVWIDLQNQLDLDLTSSEMLTSLAKVLMKTGLTVRFVNVHDRVAQQLELAGLVQSVEIVSRLLPTHETGTTPTEVDRDDER